MGLPSTAAGRSRCWLSLYGVEEGFGDITKDTLSQIELEEKNLHI